jgi:ribA/ribD-fused uncharacterized protein
MASESKVIHFYSADGANGIFSNFYKAPVKYNGKVYPTSEHAYQAAKFDYPGASEVNKRYVEAIRLEPSPAKIFFMGRQKKIGGLPWRVELSKKIELYKEAKVRPDWERQKLPIMKEIVRAKFTQHLKLQDDLLRTKDAVLVEHTSRDKYWGDGGNGSGANHLGKLLMELREEFSADAFVC